MDHLEYIVTKLDKIDAKQDSMNDVLTKNTIIVEQHERRSTLLEARMEPVEKHVAFVNVLVKIVVAGAGIATTLKALGLL